jgi:hypothetical protein
MLGIVKDIIEDEEFAVVMIQIPKRKAAKLRPMMGKNVVISWVN